MNHPRSLGHNPPFGPPRRPAPPWAATAEQRVAVLIARIHADCAGACGAARVAVALRREGLVIDRKRVARVMREHGVRSTNRCKRRSHSRTARSRQPRTCCAATSLRTNRGCR
ncbi:MAG: IS3 family transposase [Actinocrinis sp.]